jgi:hypothetical protein
LSSLWEIDWRGLKAGTQPLRQRKLSRKIPVKLTREGEKIGFCLADTYIDIWAQKGDGPRTYNAPDCLFPQASDATWDYYIQGITRGWGDIYDWYLPGQYIEVTGVPDGIYILETIADPENRLLETREDNNCISVFVALTRMGTSSPRARILGRGPACSALGR